VLLDNPLFNQIGSLARANLAKAGFLKQFDVGETILQQGQNCNYICVLQSGTVSVRFRLKKSEVQKEKLPEQLLALFKGLKEDILMEVASKSELIS
jgi:signal-transduction protein with cAMP-binding, CBS, and nucleotidyltransferase domain